MQDPPLTTDTGVILVASGYLFRCPECSAMSYRASALEKKVACDHCQAEFPVVEVRHRTNDADITPGVSPDAIFRPSEPAPEGHPDLPAQKSQGNPRKMGKRV